MVVCIHAFISEIFPCHLKELVLKKEGFEGFFLKLLNFSSVSGYVSSWHLGRPCFSPFVFGQCVFLCMSNINPFLLDCVLSYLFVNTHGYKIRYLVQLTFL